MTKKQKPENIVKAVYTPEYRAEVVKLALTAPSIAHTRVRSRKPPVISEKTLHGWVTAQKAASATGTTVEATKTVASPLRKA